MCGEVAEAPVRPTGIRLPSWRACGNALIADCGERLFFVNLNRLLLGRFRGA